MNKRISEESREQIDYYMHCEDDVPSDLVDLLYCSEEAAWGEVERLKEENEVIRSQLGYAVNILEKLEVLSLQGNVRLLASSAIQSIQGEVSPS